MLQCVTAVGQCLGKLLLARGSRHSAQLRSCPVSATSLIVDSNICAAKELGGSRVCPTGNFSKQALAHEAAVAAVEMAGHYQLQDRAWHLSCQLRGAGLSQEPTAGDIKQPILLQKLTLF